MASKFMEMHCFIFLRIEKREGGANEEMSKVF